MRDDIFHNASRLNSSTSSFLGLILTINLVMDGLPKLASPVQMQIMLLPMTALFIVFSGRLLQSKPAPTAHVQVDLDPRSIRPASIHWLIVFFTICFWGLVWYQTVHFSLFGYRLSTGGALLTLLASFGVVAVSFRGIQVPPSLRTSVYIAAYVAGQVLAIMSFPLNYLRSDMLAVVSWADRALLAGGNPYQHFYVADRIYDFPYLPGVLLAFAPAQVLHVDPRWTGIVSLVLGMVLIYRMTAEQHKYHVSVLIGLVLLSPYLQYRHDLYTQPHFLSLIAIFVCMHRRRFMLAAAAFGVSVAISQFSWVILPFFLLNALRRGGWKEVGKIAFVVAGVASLITAPFLLSGAQSIAHNAVGQWDRLERPIARPINLSFWASFFVRPTDLKWLQLCLLSGVFASCWLRTRCVNLVDTLRWMIVALIIFILFNVLVDGYFYLMLLIPMFVFTCVVNGWWEPWRPAASHGIVV